MRNTIISTLMLIAAVTGCASEQTTHESGGQSTAAAPKPADPARFYPGISGYHRTITTNSKQAQKWFDQGIVFLYAFNHDEAVRSFTQAATLDPGCAMAWWGVAYAHGIHINNPVMTERQSREGYEAATRALAALDNETSAEKALVMAVAKRYEYPPPADRKPLDRAYADAMREAWAAHGDDADIGALYAESLMDLQPWDLWTHDGQPKGNTVEIVATLETVMSYAPQHPGANHFYIHTIEASPNPEKAVASADRLRAMVPGAGHLVHMPAHIYARVGRWAEVSDANVRAIAADENYFALAPPPDFYNLYFLHNIHFLAYSAMFEGRYETAMAAARQVESDIPPEFLREYAPIADGFMPVVYHVMIRFGKWDDVLNEPQPPEFRLVSRAFWRYARGIALASLGRTQESQAELDALTALTSAMPDDWYVGNNPAKNVLEVAVKMLAGELAYAEGKTDDAFALLREAVKLEDDLIYDEPPGWMHPVRHAQGALLLDAAAKANASAGADGAETAKTLAAQAEQVYRADLKIHPNNGWALIGLHAALEMQGKTGEAEQAQALFAKAWTRADVQPMSSCYCAPGG